MSEIQRDLASTELWHVSLERSLRRRALAPIARKREARRKRTSLVAGAAVATAPMLPSLGAADAASSHGTHDRANSHRLQDQVHERILLRRGDANGSVGAVQRALDITVDDIFGPQTEAAVRAMQQRAQLPATGKVDARTWLTLFPHDAIIAVTAPTVPGAARSAQPTAQWAAVTVPTASKTDAKASRTTPAVATASAAETPAVFGHGSGGVHASLIGASQHEATAAPESAAPQSPSPSSPDPHATTPRATTPAPTTVSLPGSTGGQAIQIQAPTPGSAQSAADMVAEMLAAANAIDAHHYSYSWGGGHNSSFSGPYDCSGAVSAVLHAAGLVSAPMVSGDYMRWGAPGPGTVTIYANAGHVYMSINGKFFGTSYANAGGGAGWYKGSARPGFVVVHVPFEKMHLRTSAARVQAAKARRQQRRQPTAVAAVQPRTSGSTVAPATGNGGTAYVGASAPAAAQPQSAPAATPGATTVAPSAETPAAVAPSAGTPATVAPSAGTPATVAPPADAPASVAPSSSVPVPAAVPSPTSDAAPAPAPAPATTAPAAVPPAPSTAAPAPTASTPATAPSSVEPADAVTPTPPATQPAAAPVDPPTGDAAGTPATDTAAPAADPGAQNQASAPATAASDTSASAPAASESAPAAVPAAA
ncbi:MAG TPA: peptidoglycan-binding protein [Thermoleophilaceae bacterium]|nr:peptidoglycan-binding protein [Thermoleophilaceae bacterium]